MATTNSVETTARDGGIRTLSNRDALEVVLVLVPLLACLLSACSTAPVLGRDETYATPVETEMTGPLTGEALAQRKIEMRRAARDLVQFGATVETMRLRRDRDRDDFEDFVAHFLRERVDPLFAGTETNEDPELAVLDAELRLVKAELLIETTDYWNAGDVIDQVEDRYGDRQSMLVRFPVGRQSTIAESIEYLRGRNKGAPGHWTARDPRS